MAQMVGNSMKEDELKNLRVHYTKGVLIESEAGNDPLHLFHLWMSEAKKSEIKEPNAMILSTVRNAQPKARVVLLKNLSENGFVFFTNYLSHKAEELSENANAALTFFWDHLERQVRIEGKIAKVSEAESTTYFHSRPRESQIGAWVSEQSTVVDSREILENRNLEFSQKFENETIIPKPPFWGGFVLSPHSIEFWQGRPSRLHDRLLYTKTENGWNRARLSP